MTSSEQTLSVNRERLSGMVYAFFAFSAWGLLPLYWKLLEEIPAMEILAHRIFWSFLFMLLVLFLTGDISQIKKIMES